MKILIGVLIVLLLVLQYKLWVADGGYHDVRRLRGEVSTLKAENEQLQARNRALQAEVEDLKGGLTVVEDLARDELGMIKQGETFFQVIPQQKNDGKEAHP
ncbi:MAG TPA: cell division protein FtsB [Gammaproteobacteria bacterium]|nr:cell division protein FtsB [Gammaproteobacteria bacterium]